MKKNNFAFWLLGFGSGIVTLSSIGLIIAVLINNAEIKQYNIKISEQEQKVLDVNKKDEKNNNISSLNKPKAEISKEAQNEVIKKQEDIKVEAQNQAETQNEVKIQNQVKPKASKQVSTSKKNGVYNVVIPPKLSAREICKLLEQKGVIDSAEDFLIYIKGNGKAGDLNSGEFELHYTTNYRQLLKLLSI